MKAENNMIAAIKRREDLEPTYVSLRKLLASVGMEHYLNLASDRIVEAEFVDGEETLINFSDFPDLLFTSDGLFSCRHMLENYLPFDNLADAYQLLIDAEAHNREVNEMAAAFRNMSLSQLWTCYQNTKKANSQEAARIVRGWVKTELWSRSIFSAIWRKSKEIATSAYLHMRYHRLFGIVRSCAERA